MNQEDGAPRKARLLPGVSRGEEGVSRGDGGESLRGEGDVLKELRVMMWKLEADQRRVLEL